MIKTDLTQIVNKILPVVAKQTTLEEKLRVAMLSVQHYPIAEHLQFNSSIIAVWKSIDQKEQEILQHNLQALEAIASFLKNCNSSNLMEIPIPNQPVPILSIWYAVRGINNDTTRSKH